MAFQRLPEERPCCCLIAGLGGITFQHLALMIIGALQIVRLPVDFHIGFVETPSPWRYLMNAATRFGRISPQTAGPTYSKITAEFRTRCQDRVRPANPRRSARTVGIPRTSSSRINSGELLKRRKGLAGFALGFRLSGCATIARRAVPHWSDSVLEGIVVRHLKFRTSCRFQSRNDEVALPDETYSQSPRPD